MLGRGLQPFCIAFLVIAAHGMPFAQSSPPDATAKTPVTWLIFVDGLHLDFRNTGRIRDMMRTIVAELGDEDDQFAIVSSGPSALAVDPTTDRQALAEAIKRIAGNALKYEHIQSPDGAAEVLYRASISVAAVQSVLSNASDPLSGIKALLYISNGSSFDILPEPAPLSRIGRVRVPTRAEIHEQLAKLTATAAQSGIRIFTINRGAGFDLDDPFPYSNDPVWQAHLVARQTFLRSLSDTTAGFAVVDGDFVTGLRRVADAMRR